MIEITRISSRRRFLTARAWMTGLLTTDSGHAFHKPINDPPYTYGSYITFADLAASEDLKRPVPLVLIG